MKVLEGQPPWKEAAYQHARRADYWREVCEHLWGLLDDVSTMDDACKSDDKAFRKRAYQIAERRNEYLQSPDGRGLKPLGIVNPAVITLATQRTVRQQKALELCVELLHETISNWDNAGAKHHWPTRVAQRICVLLGLDRVAADDSFDTYLYAAPGLLRKLFGLPGPTPKEGT